MRKLINSFTLLILFQFAISCNYIDNGVDFKISNKSDATISNIKLYTSEKLDCVLIEKLEKNKTENKFLSLNSNKCDGNYIIEFERNNLKKKYCFGYYTNGSNIENEIIIEITKDSINTPFEKY
jgi:hypothetical protein